MSWLRMASIASFKKFNPTWEIRLHDTPSDIRAHNLQYGQEADWEWWRVLAEHGGFQVATDIVFVRPVPDGWLDCKLNACLNGQANIYQNAMIGAVPQHPFIVKVEKACENMDKTRNLGYQDMGVNLLSRMRGSGGGFYDQPMDALCYFRHTEVGRLWSRSAIDLPDSVIGVHWYGGHPMSEQFEAKARPHQSRYIIQLAKEVFSETFNNPHGKQSDA